MIKQYLRQYLVQLKTLQLSKLAGIFPAFNGLKDFVIVAVYFAELLTLLFVWDWFVKLPMHQTVTGIIPGAAVFAYLSYIAYDYGNIAVKNWIEKPSILNVLFSVIKVPVLYYLFARIYILVKS